MNTTIRNLDEEVYREFRSRAVVRGQNVGQFLNEAMRAYLLRMPVAQRVSTLRTLEPEPFPDGNESLSQEIDAVVYGAGRS